MEGFAIERTYQIDDIPTTVATGKTVVEMFAEADHKGIGIIPLVYWTGSEELIALSSKLIQQSFVARSVSTTLLSVFM